LNSETNQLRLGGQALPEGILIKGPIFTVIAYREENDINTVSIKWGFKVLNDLKKIPFLRGLITIAETIGLSMKSIFVMAEVSDDDINTDSIYFKILIGFMFVLVMVFTIGLVVFLPKFSSKAILNFANLNSVFGTWIELSIRFLLFFTYIYMYRFFSIGQNMFKYHAAEHMAIHTYENKHDLTINNIKKFNKEHPRCGTAFLAFVFIYANIIFHTLVIDVNFLFLIRLSLSLFVISLTYETLLLGWKSNNLIIGKIINLPGYLLQKITTIKPKDSDIELAIVATKKCIELHK
jgi:uncharacterized protein YqhQ